MTYEDASLFDASVADPVLRTAVVSSDGVYRYRLGRVWAPTAPVMCWVMLNPSTADAATDDATIRRCVFYARREGCGSIDVVNLFAYRATDPDRLVAAATAGVHVVGPANLYHAMSALRAANVVVAGWGANYRRLPESPVVRMMAAMPVRPVCLGVTSGGYPRHPGRLSNDEPLEPFTI